MSTIFPFPSSPHWAPTTTSAVIFMFASGSCARAPSRRRARLGPGFRIEPLGPVEDMRKTPSARPRKRGLSARRCDRSESLRAQLRHLRILRATDHDDANAGGFDRAGRRQSLGQPIDVDGKSGGGHGTIKTRKELVVAAAGRDGIAGTRRIHVKDRPRVVFEARS